MPTGTRPILPKSVTDTLRQTVKSRGLLLRTDSVIIFVCGGTQTGSSPTGRQLLLEYSTRHLSEYRFFEAERVFEALVGKSSTDLLTLEERLADYSDCIIVVVESAGAICELGAFATKKEVAEIVLAINELRFKDDGSFISSGPVKRLNRVSRFKPVIHTDIERILTIAPDVEKRLRSIQRHKRVRIDLHTLARFRTCMPKHRMLFLCDLISLLCPLSFRDLLACLHSIYGPKNLRIGIELGMLKALGMVLEHGDYLLRGEVDLGYFFDFERVDMFELRATVIRHYHKYDRQRMEKLLL